MIPRYSRPEMTAIWEPENKFRIWFEIEAHACDAQAELGVMPKSAAKTIWEKGAFEVERIDQIDIGGGNERRHFRKIVTIFLAPFRIDTLVELEIQR